MTNSEYPTVPLKNPICPACHAPIGKEGEIPERCPKCGHFLHPQLEKIQTESKSSEESSSEPRDQVTLIQGHVPDESIQFTIGPYQILKLIGKGGMGEVFLAYDTTCGRRIALKRIRTDLVTHQQLFKRFQREARITSQLTHPSIIPIYAIHSENNLLYYTMPYVEGETFKQVLKKARRQEKKGEKVDHLGGSIPALVRIFINICQAVAYAHSKGVLHRDLKPENIIIGKFGEVLILDWGLAKLIHAIPEIESESDNLSGYDSSPDHELTHTGKVVGTVSYMAPERALGLPATTETDIYALGIMLYQILTLHLPFVRGTLKEFQKSMIKEKFIEPSEVAPYRDVPRILSQITKKCLSPNPEQRYHLVEDLIHNLENYIEGRSDWFQVAELDIKKKVDWEFQENVLIAEHIAITRNTEVSDWVSLMISKISVTDNTKIEANVRLGEKGHGIGFLLSIPEAAEREHLNDGYCLWIGSENHRATKLLRSTVEVMSTPDIFLRRFEWYRVRIEKVDTNIHFYLNDTLQFSYISHSPLIGTHIGILARDADFEIKDFLVFAGSQNIMVKCLSVPDAFLANEDFNKALIEYRRIGNAFPGRAEGREAMFRAGVTLIEQAKKTLDKEQATKTFDLALEEFEKLHRTPGAPLEYLGKALVYEALQDYEEEIKCFELALRRYPNHPLLPVLQEQIVFRMHDSSHHHRLATYNFILLVVRHLPEVADSNNAKKLFTSLQKHWEQLPFIEVPPDAPMQLSFARQLAFWIDKPYVIVEILQDLLKENSCSCEEVANGLFSLIELGHWEMAKSFIETLPEDKIEILKEVLEPIKIIFLAYEYSINNAIDKFIQTFTPLLNFGQVRALIFLMEMAIDQNKSEEVNKYSNYFESLEISDPAKEMINCQLIWSYLSQKNFEKAGEILHKYPIEVLSKESSLLHFLYGCWLYATESKEIAQAHFSGILEVSYPRTWSLFAHYLHGKIGPEQRWYRKAFPWEKRQLERQLALFSVCSPI